MVPLLVCLLTLIDRMPLVQMPARRGRPTIYSDRLFLKALVLMIVRHLTTVHALLMVLEEPERAAIRALLTENRAFPTRRTWERRLAALPAALPTQNALLGCHLITQLDP